MELLNGNYELVVRLAAFLHFHFLFRIMLTDQIGNPVCLGVRHVFAIKQGNQFVFGGVRFLHEFKAGMFQAV